MTSTTYCTDSVFLQRDRVRRPIQPPYDEPCQVLSRSDKTFKTLPNGREETASVDRLKAAAIETTQPDQPASSSPSSSPSPAPTPVNAAAVASPQAALSVKANTATKRKTRSGRRVRFRFVPDYHF